MKTIQLTEMLNRRVTSLRAHCSFQSAYLQNKKSKMVLPHHSLTLTLKPARCNLNATKSRKLTNWLNTMLFVVASCRLRLVSSSIRASIFVEDLQVSRSRRPRMPCLPAAVLASSPNSRAGASRSTEIGRWQTGQAG